MDLQAEVKIIQVENIFDQAIVNIMVTHNWCNEKVRQAVSQYEVTAQQFNILRILKDQFPKPSTINLLKDRMLDKMSDASRIVDRLVQKDLVIKATNKIDKRAVDILISEKGLKLLKKMDKELSFASIVSTHLTQEEAGKLNTLLDKLRG